MTEAEIQLTFKELFGHVDREILEAVIIDLAYQISNQRHCRDYSIIAKEAIERAEEERIRQESLHDIIEGGL